MSLPLVLTGKKSSCKGAPRKDAMPNSRSGGNMLAFDITFDKGILEM